MSKFEKGWTKHENESFAQKTRETIRGPQPMKPQIQKATGQLNQEINRLDGALARLKQREQSIFKKTVSAVQAHDEQTSKMLHGQGPPRSRGLRQATHRL